MNPLHDKRFEEIKIVHRRIAELIPIINSYTIDCRPEKLLFPDLQTLPKDILRHYIDSIQPRTLARFTEVVKWDDFFKDHPKRQANEANGFVGLFRNIPFYYTNITKYSIEEFVKDTEKQILDAEEGIKHARQSQQTQEQQRLDRDKERLERRIEELRISGMAGSLEELIFKQECNRLQNTKPKLPYEFIQKELQEKKYITEWRERLGIVTNGMDEALALIQTEKVKFEKEQQELIDVFENAIYLYQWNDITPLISLLLYKSEYPFEFNRNIELESTKDVGLIIDYHLPSFEDIQKIDSRLPITKSRKVYEDILYAMTIRSLAEIFHFDERKYIDSICFNGIVTVRNKCTGKLEDRIILSLNATREQIESLDLEYISPKECFKFLKGVSASKLHDSVSIVPIHTISFSDKRVVEAKNVETDSSLNLAEMDWEEFEHLVRQIFEWEFNSEGTEVHVTQASRDGGVDAIVFDPDPIRGGKIVIQAKRYTNTVGVSAVRDLYGTVINEGANKGILITTSDYGADSYQFAQGKPLTLLNGGHLLYLMEKHGRKARIDLPEAKAKQKGIDHL